VELSLELTAAALDTKLVASLGGAGQPGELSAFVDEWCAVDAERRALPRPSVVRTNCRSFVDDREALLQRAGKLADDLQVADPGAARSPVTAARRARDAAKSAKGMFGFVGRERVIQRRFNMSVPRARVPQKAYALRERSER
jgi:hypothetical protein